MLDVYGRKPVPESRDVGEENILSPSVAESAKSDLEWLTVSVDTLGEDLQA